MELNIANFIMPSGFVQYWGYLFISRFSSPEFYIYLADSKIKAIHRNRKSRKHSVHYENNHKTRWIETLLQALWRIVAPYLINVRRLSHEDALSIMREWLNKCDKLRQLDFGVNSRIRPNLNAAARVGYLPISFSDLKTENRELANIICHGDSTSFVRWW